MKQGFSKKAPASGTYRHDMFDADGNAQEKRVPRQISICNLPKAQLLKILMWQTLIEIKKMVNHSLPRFLKLQLHQYKNPMLHIH